MPTEISPLADVHPSAQLGENVTVGPFSVIGPDVVLGDGCTVKSHAVVKGPTVMGKHNTIFQFASVGEDPQDLKFKGEVATLEVGDNNTFRECCTVHRGTENGGGVTKLGNDNLIMNYVHIGHDCIIGNQVILVNATALAGHVIIGDHAILGGATLVRQFLHVGAHAFSAMGSVINKDVPPFILVEGHMAKPKTINAEGLKRRGFDKADLQAIKTAYKTLYKSNLKLDEAVVKMRAMENPHVDAMCAFIADSRTRSAGVIR